jgi:hypothetical protein
MPRNRKNIGHGRKKKSLYEVMGDARLKSRQPKTLEQPPPEKIDSTAPPKKHSLTVQEKPTRWPRKPKIIQFNAGRLEISIPYQLAIAFLLFIILLILVVFRLGQKNPDISASITKMQNKNKPTGKGQNTNKNDKILANDGEIKAVESKGDHRIVIQEYQIRAHLEPVQQHFAQFGIETEIRNIGGTHFLLTREKYESPKREGTDGYAAKQKIIAVGAQYKAPPGYETFARNLFKDAYGMKFDD